VALMNPSAINKRQVLIVFRTASVPLAHAQSERDARGPKDDDKSSVILGVSVSSSVEN